MPRVDDVVMRLPTLPGARRIPAGGDPATTENALSSGETRQISRYFAGSGGIWSQHDQPRDRVGAGDQDGALAVAHTQRAGLGLSEAEYEETRFRGPLPRWIAPFTVETYVTGSRQFIFEACLRTLVRVGCRRDTPRIPRGNVRRTGDAEGRVTREQCNRALVDPQHELMRTVRDAVFGGSVNLLHRLQATGGSGYGLQATDNRLHS